MTNIKHIGRMFETTIHRVKKGQIIKIGKCYYIKVKRDWFLNLHTFKEKYIGVLALYDKKVYICSDAELTLTLKD